MRVLLTGATGFVGSRVLSRLLDRGDEVQVLALPETVDRLPSADRLRVIAGSLEDLDALVEASRQVEIVYHLGAIHLSALRAGDQPRDLEGVNVRGTENVLRAAVANRVRRVVFTSSVAVYNRAPLPFLWPLGEDYPLRASGDDNLRNYAQSKIEGENLIRRYHHERGIEYVILRSSSVYGPKARWVEELVRGLAAGPWRAYSPAGQFAGNQWVFVQDLASAVVLAGTEAHVENDIYNIAGGELFSLRDIFVAVSALLGRPVWKGPLHPPPGLSGNYALRYDLSRAQSRLGYMPRVRLPQGLAQVLEVMDPPLRFTSPAPRPYADGLLSSFGWGDPESA